jgi:Tfp pilus assembly protein PilO
MTNLQEGSPRLSAQNLQRLWLWTPIGLGALVAALLVGLVLFPIGRQLLRDSQRLQKLEALLQERSLLRSQLQAIDEKQQKTQAASDKLLNLIAGSGDLSTFLTRLQQEAQRTGVQLDLFEPQPVVAAGPATQQDGAEAPATSIRQSGWERSQTGRHRFRSTGTRGSAA